MLVRGRKINENGDTYLLLGINNLISLWEGGPRRGRRNNTWEPTTNNMLDIVPMTQTKCGMYILKTCFKKIV
jgi:hypothetical protein